MVDVYIGIGSNIEPKINVKNACERLRLDFPSIEFSRIFESASVGFEGDNFLNLVARFKSEDINPQESLNSEQALTKLIRQLKLIENELGRVRGSQKFSDRNIDIDILLYGDLQTNQPIELPRDEILENAYVLWPLVELAPELRDPLSHKYYSEYWSEFDKSSQTLKPVELD